MNRFDRVASILIVLQTKRYVTAEDLAERFEVSKRTIYRDLATLGAAGLPLGADAGKGYFLMEGYRLPPVMFSRDEAAALLMGAKMLGKLSDSSVDSCFASAFDKVKAVLPVADKDLLEQLDKEIEVYNVTEKGHDACGNRYITAIHQALAQKKVIEINYLTFSRDNHLTVRQIEPIGLCFYSMHWHLIAWCRLRGEFRDFRADRIVSLTDTGEHFAPRKVKSLNDYFKAIRHRAEVQEAKITVDAKTAVLMETSRTFYGFLESVSMPQGVVMHFVTSDYDYLARWLMMFVDGLIEVEPPQLAARFAVLLDASKFLSVAKTC